MSTLSDFEHQLREIFRATGDLVPEGFWQKMVHPKSVRIVNDAEDESPRHRPALSSAIRLRDTTSLGHPAAGASRVFK
jgi:hypothetical protein